MDIHKSRIRLSGGATFLANKLEGVEKTFSTEHIVLQTISTHYLHISLVDYLKEGMSILKNMPTTLCVLL